MTGVTELPSLTPGSLDAPRPRPHAVAEPLNPITLTLIRDCPKIYPFFPRSPDVMSGRYVKNQDAVTSLKYHILWCSKYRRQVLTEEVATQLRKLLEEKASEMGIVVDNLEIHPDHVEMRVEADPSLCVAEIVNNLKGHTSKILRNDFPALRSRLPSLWTRSYLATTLGTVSPKTIKEFLESQKTK